jgi:hypothetical protein
MGDEDKGCSSSMCRLFDFEITQLKEMFPLCSDDVLNVAMGKSANLEEAVDYVMQQLKIQVCTWKQNGGVSCILIQGNGLFIF